MPNAFPLASTDWQQCRVATPNREPTGFLHLDLDINAYEKDRRGGNRLTSSLSLDNEEADGCTVVVKGFHNHLLQWIELLKQRRLGRLPSGETTDCKALYNVQDRAKWGEATPVPCPAWGVRLSLLQLIHGSTIKSTRRRRTILPWFTGILEDHEHLEVSDTTYSEVRLYHMDLRVPVKDPSGKPHRMGAPKERFLGSLVLGSSSALGDALVGRLRWTDPRVLKERNILLGKDHQAALEYVKATRERLVQEFRVAFSYMVELEKREYGELSYFVAGQPGGETDDSGSDDCSSMGSLGYGSMGSNTDDEDEDQ
jgi:hypothetical protein